MSYWLYITNSDNWEVTKETNTLGASERHRNALARMDEGDLCLIYVKSEKKGHEVIEPKIVGEYKIVSKVFEDNKKIFHAPPNLPSETFNLRIKLKPLRILKNPIEFKPLVPKMTFIKNKKRWSLSIRGRAVKKFPRRTIRTYYHRRDSLHFCRGVQDLM